jgi:hypothetical protein
MCTAYLPSRKHAASADARRFLRDSATVSQVGDGVLTEPCVPFFCWRLS